MVPKTAHSARAEQDNPLHLPKLQKQHGQGKKGCYLKGSQTGSGGFRYQFGYAKHYSEMGKKTEEKHMHKIFTFTYSYRVAVLKQKTTSILKLYKLQVSTYFNFHVALGR